MGAQEIFEGLGTAENPYLIQNEEDLFGLADLVNNENEGYAKSIGKYYRLTNDIELTKAWMPIGGKFLGIAAGKYKCGFCGIFDGGGHVISNMNVKLEGNEIGFIGLFGLVQKMDPNSGVVRNLGVKGKIVVSNCNNVTIGAIIGVHNDGLIENCYTDVNIVVTELKDYSSVGGVVGRRQSDSILQNCYACGNISVKGGKPTVGYICDEQRQDIIAYWPKDMKVEVWDSENNQLEPKKSGLAIDREVMLGTTKYMENIDKTFLQLLNEQVSGEMMKWTQKKGSMPAFGGDESSEESEPEELTPEVSGIVPPNLWLQEEGGVITACYPKEQCATDLFRSQGSHPLCGVFSSTMAMLYYTGVNLLNRPEKPLNLDLDKIQPLDIANAMNKANGEPKEEHYATYNTSNTDSIFSFMTDWAFSCKDQDGNMMELKIKETHKDACGNGDDEYVRIKNIICHKSPLYMESGPCDESGYKLTPLVVHISSTNLKNTGAKLSLPGYKGLVTEMVLGGGPKDHYLGVFGYYKDYLVCINSNGNSFQDGLFLMKAECLQGHGFAYFGKVDIIRKESEPFKIGYTKDFDATAEVIRSAADQNQLEFIQVYSSSQKNIELNASDLSVSAHIASSSPCKCSVDVYSIPDDSNLDFSRFRDEKVEDVINKYVYSGISLCGEMKGRGFITLENNAEFNNGHVDGVAPLYTNILVRCRIASLDVQQKGSIDVQSTGVSLNRRHGFFRIDNGYLRNVNISSSSCLPAFPMSISCSLKSQPRNVLMVGI